jgi:hypothetical protein
MKKIIFGPLIVAARRAVRVLNAFLNPCPPPSVYWDLPRSFSFHEKLFLS